MNAPIYTEVNTCIVSPTIEQLNIYSYNSAVTLFVQNYIKCAQQKEQFGKKSQSYYDKINNLYYLLLYISVVNEQRQVDVNNGITNSCSTYGDLFICMIDYFKCLNIDITPLLTIFNLNCAVACSGPSGLGFEDIWDDSNDQPPCDLLIIE